MSNTTDLASWLTRIWDEEERLAKKATPGPWRHDPRKHWRKPGTAWFEEAVFAGPAGKDAECIAGTGESDDPQSIYDAAFIAALDPASVLARIAADRAILAECSVVLEDKTPSRVRERILAWAVLRQLASIYRNHPDWREAWQ
jgi:hypothetical protein